ncbi:isocitrate lyase/PEP mutase family protein [Thalassotalea mangrovi]|uniref:Carboxyvinyl-carboxyphosphonate phosphorylmutase n=1 Tax=Thalassotalea mangrovi TaxID=2572245 RepID=A0A4U1B1S6_9GAMM|nr:isocitrate lyase/phosphoenolpyruvate mutase family protein [Thalassotalea mangrovi]TKB43272.1 carboxyvinyl-carboxyphosphonate phosphorylmutase [Thalassotalea mangrovi]
MHAQSLRQLIAKPEILVAPGGYDALSAVLIEQAQFDAMYLSGASIAYTRFGRPDIGLVSMNEVADVISQIRERTELPLIVDADTGFGNAINVQRTVRLFERCGASAIQIEDQQMPKRCGHLKGKTLVSKDDMVGKIQSAIDARMNEQTMIVARTDAIAVEGFDSAIERAVAYYQAGADMLFIEAPESHQQMLAMNELFSGKIPLLANMVEGGSTPIESATYLKNMGYSLVLFPGALVRAHAFMAQEFLSSLKQSGNTKPFQSKMLNLTQLNELLGTDDILANGRKYQGR